MRRRWTCSSCLMTVRYLPGYAAPELPEGWAQQNGSLVCLACRRQVVADAAVAEARAEDLATERRARQVALVRFELLRGLAPKDAARIAGTSTRVASQVHRELVATGEVTTDRSAPALKQWKQDHLERAARKAAPKGLRPKIRALREEALRLGRESPHLTIPMLRDVIALLEEEAAATL